MSQPNHDADQATQHDADQANGLAAILADVEEIRDELRRGSRDAAVRGPREDKRMRTSAWKRLFGGDSAAGDGS